MSAVTGIVNTQVYTMFLAMLHLTAEALLVTPTPVIEPAITCVVLTGIPKIVLPIITPAPELSAQNP